MPIAFALFASALIHTAALLGPGWSLPGQDEPEAVPPLNAVLTHAAEPAAVAKPTPRPVARPSNPRPRPPVAANAPAEVPAAAAAANSVTSADPAVAPSEPAFPAVVAAAAPVAPPPVAIALPGQGRLRYLISKGASGSGMVVGQSVHTWSHDGRHYTLQSVSETTGLAALFKPARVVQVSHGDVVTGGLRPADFRHERAGGGVDTATFDRERHVVGYAGREEGIDDAVQDMLSLYYQLALLGVTAETRTVEVPVATGRKLERYRFELMGEESVRLADGSDHAAVRLGAQSGSDRIEVWLAIGVRSAPSLPLKIRFVDRHDELFDQVLEAAP